MDKKKLLFLPLLLLASCADDGAESSSGSRVIDLSDLPSSIELDETIDLSALGLSGVEWSIDDPLVATLEGTTVTPLRVGTIGITATPNDSPRDYVTEYVNVKRPEGNILSIDNASSTQTVRVGETFKFTASIAGDIPNKDIGWIVSNDAIASISEDGTLTAKAVGELTVTAYSLYSPLNIAANVDVSIVASGDNQGETESKEVSLVAVDFEGETQFGETDKQSYELVWEDDFLGSKLNLNNWEPMMGNGSAYDNPGWGNAEKQFYREENATPIDGELIITAKYCDPDQNLDQTYTSSRLRSARKVADTYGYIEARIACPSGDGLWPAFWMLPEAAGTTAYGGWPNSGEIDILEAKGRITYGVDGTIHYYDTTSHDHAYTNVHYDFPEDQEDGTIMDYHTYAVRWEEGCISWYCDDICYGYINQDNDPWTCDGKDFPAPFDKPFHLLLNLAVGGNYDGYREPLPEELPAQMKVDYVRWYKAAE